MPFLPGQSGNPKGRPKGGSSFSTLLKTKESLTHLFLEEAQNKWPEIIQQLFSIAAKGNLKAITIICDHLLIKPPQTLMVEHTHDNPEEMTKVELMAYILERKKLEELEVNTEELSSAPLGVN